MRHELPNVCTPDWAFHRYESIRQRLPGARFDTASITCGNLGELEQHFDVFLFDSFGVLNVGDTPIPGAQDRIQKLRRAGKQVAVLTNAATGPLSGLVEKYAKLGFDFWPNEIISSREILSKALARFDGSDTWAVVAPEASRIDELGINAVRLGTNQWPIDAVDGFILLSSQDFGNELQERLQAALLERPRPLLVGNPDLVAPREAVISLEPGAYAHEIADRCGVEPRFFGKPFANAFEEALARFGVGVSRDRIAMIGDTLHTDILGGAAAGIRTVLVTDYGVLKELDLPTCLDVSGIRPDYIIPNI